MTGPNVSRCRSRSSGCGSSTGSTPIRRRTTCRWPCTCAATSTSTHCGPRSHMSWNATKPCVPSTPRRRTVRSSSSFRWSRRSPSWISHAPARIRCSLPWSTSSCNRSTSPPRYLCGHDCSNAPTVTTSSRWWCTTSAPTARRWRRSSAIFSSPTARQPQGTRLRGTRSTSNTPITPCGSGTYSATKQTPIR